MDNHTTRIKDPDDFGKAVHDRRKALGYTQKNISEITGISASFISDLENGKSTTELGKAMMIAGLLGLNIYLSER